ncbi:MAG: WYL domain-containing protein [Deltaproteobacteria bacterium]|nr:WYL domain-containing protein [Deltaproteobacteria bacterium]
MKKAERVLDLVAFLLDSREPVSFEEIRNAFPEDYQEGSETAVARKFERDKADIVELGLPLALRIGEEYDKEGYVIERDSYELPGLDLGPEELALLFLAGSAALQIEGSPFGRDLHLAMNKIAFSTGLDEVLMRPFSTAPASPAHSPRQQENLEALHRAIAARKTVTMTYHGLWRDEITQRKVDPYGLAYRRGDWILVGHCHLRKDVRQFHVGRIRGLAVNPLKPRSPDFEAPEGFVLSEHVPAQPWWIRVHDPVDARIRFEPPVAEAIASELGPAVRAESDGEARIFTFEGVTYLGGLLPLVLMHRARARVLAPAELADEVRAALERIAEGGEG